MMCRVLNGSCQPGGPWHGTLALAAGAPSGDAAAPAQPARSPGATGGGPAGPSALPSPGGSAPWLLLNLSGPVASRLECDPRLAGIAAAAGAPAQAVLLTDAQIDQVAGLINLRGGACIDLYATPSVFEDLSMRMPVLPELQRHCGVHWHMVPVAGDQRVAEFPVHGFEGLQFTAFDTGHAPAGCVGGDVPADATGQCIAIGVQDLRSGRRLVFSRGLGAMALSVAGVLEGVQGLVVDPGEPLSSRASADLLAWMAALPVARKVLLGAQEPLQALARWGIEAGVDGLEIVL
jgi:pyrroloquinoline quinone biosynthesis protein B